MAGFLLLALGRPLPAPAAAQQSVAPAATPGYTDLADLVVASPVIVRAQVVKAGKLSRRLAGDVPPGEARHLMEMRLVGALKAPGLLPAGAEWLWQGPEGHFAAKGRDVLAFLQPAGPGRKPEIAAYRLTSARGQLPWSETLEARIRSILADLAAHGQAPRVREVKSGFHVPGTVQDEAESQIFLVLEDGRPITLSVLRRLGEEPAITVATGDMIDESAKPIRRETLLWRALACDLPRVPPPGLAGDPGLVRDYEAVIASLGDCGRSRPAT
ncbi:hypothetical protein [Thermaurantiacus sp.]